MKNLVSIADIDSDTSADDLFDLEQAYMKAVTAIKDTDRTGHFHPSANDRCGRANVYEYIRAPALTSAQAYARATRYNAEAGSLTTKEKAAKEAKSEKVSKMIPDLVRERDSLDFGHKTHELLGERVLLIKAHYEALGYVVNVELERTYDPSTDWLYRTFGIGGTADIILEITSRKMSRQRITVENKSIKRDLFLELKGPKEAHVRQAHIYAFRFDTPGIAVFYFCKDDADKKVYPLLFDYGIFESVINLYAEWLAHAQNGTLPDRKEDFYSCPRCVYQHLCKPPILENMNTGKKHAIARARGGLRKGPMIKTIPGLVTLRKKT